MHTVAVEPGSRARGASVLKPLLAWVAAASPSFARDRTRWVQLARRAVTTSDNDATATLWDVAGGSALLAALDDRLDLRWRIDPGTEHPALRVAVTAEELAVAFGALAADDGEAAASVRRCMRDVPDEQTFGLRRVASAVLGVGDELVGVKCGWFGGERAHGVVLVEGGARIVGAVVATTGTPDAAIVAAVRAASGDDSALVAIHDTVAGDDIRAAGRQALLAALGLGGGRSSGRITP